MKKKLLIIAFLFVCAIFLTASSTHVFDERKSAPVFHERKTQSSQPFKPPIFKLPRRKN